MTESRRSEAAEVAQREKLMALEHEIDNLQQQNTQIRRSISATPQPAYRAKDRCADLLRVAKNAKDEAELYVTPRFREDAKRRQKEAEDAHFTECYGSVDVN
jgi:hypothetical protein